MDGIVAWWRGEGNAKDFKGLHHGEWMGIPHYAAGKVGQAFAFEGTIGNCVRVTGANCVGFPLGSTVRSVEFWIRMPVLPAEHPYTMALGFGYDGDQGVDGQGFYVFPRHVLTDNGMGNAPGHLAFTGHGSAFDLYAAGINLADDKWHHVAATFDGSVVRLYADCTEVASGAFSLNSSAASGVRIGGHPNMDAEYGAFLTGLIDEITLYSDVLLPSEICAIKQAGSAGKCRESVFMSPVARIHAVHSSSSPSVPSGPRER